MLFRMFGVCTPIFLLALQANADTIDYSLSNLGGNEYQYNYAVSNDGSLGTGVPIQLFDIFFSPALYEAGSLDIVTPDPLNSQWSQLILSSVGTAPAEYDALALGGGIPTGDTVSGFAVQFEWIGQGLPGAQLFEISDPNTFNVLESGQTVQAGQTAVPEPSTFWIIAIVLAIFPAGVRSVKARRLGRWLSDSIPHSRRV